MEKTRNGNRYTEEELMVRLKFFIGICLALTLIGIVFVVLYSIIFVTQPLGAISPIDSKFFELIIPVATFLCGTLSGIMLAGSGQDAVRSGMGQARAQAAFDMSGKKVGMVLPPTADTEPSFSPPLAPRPMAPDMGEGEMVKPLVRRPVVRPPGDAPSL